MVWLSNTGHSDSLPQQRHCGEKKKKEGKKKKKKEKTREEACDIHWRDRTKAEVHFALEEQRKRAR